jgi:uncharacterized membrane protein
MREWLTIVTEHASVAIDAMALLFILIGSVEAFVSGLRLIFASSASHEKRGVWLRYARWLIAGLTFQLAADIVETAVAPSWNDIGRVAAIAAIRAFLNYFLERDLSEIRERQHEAKADGGS